VTEDEDKDKDDPTVSLNRPTPRRLKTSPPRGRRGFAGAKTSSLRHASTFDPAVQDVPTPSKNKLRSEKGHARKDVDVVITTKSKKKSKRGRRKKRYRRSNPDKEFDRDGSVTFAMYTFMVFFHGAFCESPAAALESVVRSFLALFQGIILTLKYMTNRTEDGWGRAAFQFREAFICMCAFPSLLLLFPGGLVYRSFDALEPWNVSTIWTIAGRVDPRRFTAFTFGQGSDAKNVLSNKFPRDAMDDLPMPSAVPIGKYRRVSIGDGVPSDLRRRRGRGKKKVSKSRRKKKGATYLSSSSSGDSDSDSSSSDSSCSSSSSSSEGESGGGRGRGGNGREVVLELPELSSLREQRKNSKNSSLKFSRV